MKATFVVVLLWQIVSGQERRPTISFITQPEIVTDIGGTVRSDRCFPEIRTKIFIIKLPEINFMTCCHVSSKAHQKNFPKCFREMLSLITKLREIMFP